MEKTTLIYLGAEHTHTRYGEEKRKGNWTDIFSNEGLAEAAAPYIRRVSLIWKWPRYARRHRATRFLCACVSYDWYANYMRAIASTISRWKRIAAVRKTEYIECAEKKKKIKKPSQQNMSVYYNILRFECTVCIIRRTATKKCEKLENLEILRSSAARCYAKGPRVKKVINIMRENTVKY